METNTRPTVEQTEGITEKKDRSINPGQRLLDIYQAANYIGVTHWTVRESINNGTIPYVKILKRKMIDKNDLDRIISQNKYRGLI